MGVLQNSSTMIPDGVSVTVLSSIILGVYTIWSLILLILLILRRNRKQIVARNFYLILISLITTYYLVSTASIRYIVGRQLFPCFIYLLLFYGSQPGLFVPTILRCWRLFFIYQVNHLKNAYTVRFTIEESQPSTPVSATPLTVQNEETASPLENQEKTATQYYSAESLQSTVQVSQAHQEKIHQLVVKVNTTEDMIKQRIEAIARGRMYTVLETKFTELHKLHLLISPAFFFAFIIFSFVLHLIIFFVCSIASPGYFVFNTGCGAGMVTVVIVGVAIGIYLLIEFAAILLLLRTHDNWGIKPECFILMAGWFVAIALYVTFEVLYSLNAMRIDHIVPYGYVIFGACFFDNIVSCLIPIIRSYLPEKRGQVSELQFILNDEMLRKMFLKFSIESFAPEPVIFWEAVNKFRKIRNEKLRYAEAVAIVEKFLSEGADLQLNIGKRNVVYANMKTLLHTSKTVETSMFDDLQVKAEQDMLSLLGMFTEKLQYKAALQQRHEQMVLDQRLSKSIIASQNFM